MCQRLACPGCIRATFTASRALATAALPYLMELAEAGVDGALRSNGGLAEGVYLYRGRIVNEAVAGVFGLPAARLSDMMREGGAA